MIARELSIQYEESSQVLRGDCTAAAVLRFNDLGPLGPISLATMIVDQRTDPVICAIHSDITSRRSRTELTSSLVDASSAIRVTKGQEVEKRWVAAPNRRDLPQKDHCLQSSFRRGNGHGAINATLR